jgi:hypothetical protein
MSSIEWLGWEAGPLSFAGTEMLIPLVGKRLRGDAARERSSSS